MSVSDDDNLGASSAVGVLQTKEALVHLQTYGAMYLSNIQPADIEQMYGDPRMSNDQLTSAVTGMAQADNTAAASAAATVQLVFQSAAAISGIVGTALAGTGVGAVIGALVSAVFAVLGQIISSVLRGKVNIKCDSEDCLPHGGTDGNRAARHKRAIVGVNAPIDAHRRDIFTCQLLHYGSSYYSYCVARWGGLSSFMNDGMWWWGKQIAAAPPPGYAWTPYQEVLEGTVIGVKGAVNSGSTKGCHRRMYGRPEIPLVGGMTKKPGPDLYKDGGAVDEGKCGGPCLSYSTDYTSDAVTKLFAKDDSGLSQEYKARQLAVTQVLEWMATHVEYSTLSCINSTLRNISKGGGGQYVIGEAPPSMPQSQVQALYKEHSLAKYMGLPGNRYDYSGTSWVPSSKYCSRMYASIRAMFQALVAECNKIGLSKSRELLKGILTDKALNKLTSAVKAQQQNIEPWPEKVLADEVNYLHLRKALGKLSEYVYVLALEDPAAMAAYTRRGLPRGEQQRIAARAAASLATERDRIRRSPSYSYASVVRQRVQQLAINQTSIGAGGFGQLVPNWLLYSGSAALLVGSGYFIYKALQEEDR